MKTVFLLLFFCLQMGAEETLPTHVVQARALLAAMSPEFTSYNQQKTLVRWPDDPKGARCQAVCTTFLYALLERSYQWDKESIARWLGPNKEDRHADKLFARCQAGIGVSPVATQAAIRIGDLVVMDYHSDKVPTGHVGVVDALPQKSTDSKAPKNSLVFAVTIIDQSSAPHDPQDTRWIRSGTAPQAYGGLGRGTMLIATNPEGNITAWARGPASTCTLWNKDPLVFSV